MREKPRNQFSAESSTVGRVINESLLSASITSLYDNHTRNHAETIPSFLRSVISHNTSNLLSFFQRERSRNLFFCDPHATLPLQRQKSGGILLLLTDFNTPPIHIISCGGDISRHLERIITGGNKAAKKQHENKTSASWYILKEKLGHNNGREREAGPVRFCLCPVVVPKFFICE